MILYPAIDIKDGQCVRLRQGKADQVTVFSRDPVDMARHWVDQGAVALHLVDLDGAFSGQAVNAKLIHKICLAAGVPVQLGGGIRDIDTASSYLSAGVARVIVSTMALENPRDFAELCRHYPDSVGVSLDADNGLLKTKGWVDGHGQTIADVLPALTASGAAFLVYTDISRDGMQSGVNIPALQNLLNQTWLPVIAAGGVTTLEDIKTLYSLAEQGLAGIITGRAIYEHTLDLGQALDWIKSQAD